MTKRKKFEGMTIHTSQKGYAFVRLKGKSIRLHTLVWERKFGPRPKGYVIHHKDEDRMNFSLSNLELMTVSDHTRIHRGWIRRGKKWVAKVCVECKKRLPLSAFYKAYGVEINRCKPCHMIACKRFKNPVREKEYKREYYQRLKATLGMPPTTYRARLARGEIAA